MRLNLTISIDLNELMVRLTFIFRSNILVHISILGKTEVYSEGVFTQDIAKSASISSDVKAN